jgi:hypothetical protein
LCYCELSFIPDVSFLLIEFIYSVNMGGLARILLVIFIGGVRRVESCEDPIVDSPFISGIGGADHEPARNLEGT